MKNSHWLQLDFHRYRGRQIMSLANKIRPLKLNVQFIKHNLSKQFFREKGEFVSTITLSNYFYSLCADSNKPQWKVYMLYRWIKHKQRASILLSIWIHCLVDIWFQNRVQYIITKQPYSSSDHLLHLRF